MQTLVEFMNRDRLKKHKRYNYFPKSKKELIEIIEQLIEERGWKADLNDIDTSKITDMSRLFAMSSIECPTPRLHIFVGDISGWDVSNVENMEAMFFYSKFDNDISDWDVRNVKNMTDMFWNSAFEGDIENWEVDPKCDMTDMFWNSLLKSHPPTWYKK